MFIVGHIRRTIIADIRFLAGSIFNIHNLAGSGLGFYGASFGSSVQVSSYQTTTWITNSTGATQGPQVDNITKTHPSSGSINGAASVGLLDVPNHLASLQVQFSHTSAVTTQNAKMRIYDRSNINNDPSGVTCYCAEIIHPSFTQTGSLGSGDSSWIHVHGSAVVLNLMDSPGISGLSPNGPSTSSVEHTWHIAMSPSPDSVGSKTQFAAYVELEYL